MPQRVMQLFENSIRFGSNESAARPGLRDRGRQFRCARAKQGADHRIQFSRRFVHLEGRREFPDLVAQRIEPLFAAVAKKMLKPRFDFAALEGRAAPERARVGRISKSARAVDMQ